MRNVPRSNQTGFTLLEVMVALAVLAVGAALTLSLISGTLANIRKVQLRTRTIQHAETVMEMALLDDVRRATTFRGDFEDGTRWSVQVDEVQMPTPQPTNLQAPESPIKLFSYRVDVQEPDSKGVDFRLQTMKIVNVQPTNRPGQMTR